MGGPPARPGARAVGAADRGARALEPAEGDPLVCVVVPHGDAEGLRSPHEARGAVDLVSMWHSQVHETVGLVVAPGFIRLGPADVARQLVTAGVEGPGSLAVVRGVARLASAFAGNLWDVYARRISGYSPF